MTAWWAGPLAGFDLETTAKEPDRARIVTATVLVDEPGSVVDPISWLVAVDCDIPEEATDKHGITTEHAQTNGQPVARVAAEISGLLASLWHDRIPLVIFNVPYDLMVLNCERIRCGMAPLAFSDTLTPLIDPYVLDKHCHRYRKGSRQLADMCAHYGVTLENAHTSDADAAAAVKLARRIGETYSRDLGVSTRELYHRQREWFRFQTSSLEAYFRTQALKYGLSPSEAQAICLDRTWPVKSIPMPVQVP